MPEVLSTGERSRWTDLESTQETFSDSVVSGPATALTVCRKMLQYRCDPKRWFAEWAQELSLGRKDRAWHEMHTLRDIFCPAGWYDQLNMWRPFTKSCFAGTFSVSEWWRRRQRVHDFFFLSPLRGTDSAPRRMCMGILAVRLSSTIRRRSDDDDDSEFNSSPPRGTDSAPRRICLLHHCGFATPFLCPTPSPTPRPRPSPTFLPRPLLICGMVAAFATTASSWWICSGYARLLCLTPSSVDERDLKSFR